METRNEKIHAFVFGASGYTGMELCHLLVNHPDVLLHLATSDKFAGKQMQEAFGISTSLSFLPNAEGISFCKAFLKDVETFENDDEHVNASSCVAFLATPAEVSYELGAKLLSLGMKVIDLSGAHRLRENSVHYNHYKLAPVTDAVRAQVVYGLPEIFRERIKKTNFIANPGCYATASLLALYPFVKANLICKENIFISAASGVSGAGRQAREDYSFSEIYGDFRAYKVGTHQHEPEIAQTLNDACGLNSGGDSGLGYQPLFVPHLLPVARGILATLFVELREPKTHEELFAWCTEVYKNEPFVRLQKDASQVSLKHVVSTNRCEIGFTLSGKKLVITSAIDNLLKGASGQAIQNMNLLFGREEQSGLRFLRRGVP